MSDPSGDLREPIAHRAQFTVGGEAASVAALPCPYNASDETRPCWPHDLGVPMPAPQTDCTYVGWIEAVGLELFTDFTFEALLVIAEFSDDGPAFDQGTDAVLADTEAGRTCPYDGEAMFKVTTGGWWCPMCRPQLVADTKQVGKVSMTGGQWCRFTPSLTAPAPGQTPVYRRVPVPPEVHEEAPWIRCNGCGAYWRDPDCACTCVDGDENYENWVEIVSVPLDEVCTECGGTGRVGYVWRGGWVAQDAPCPSCGGTTP